MNAFKGFIMSVCTLFCVLGGLFILSPKGKFEKPVRYVFALVLLICTVSSALQFMKTDFSFSFDSFTQADTSDISVYTAKKVYETALENEGIDFEKISLITDKLENGSINITKIIILSDDDPEKIKEIVSPGGDIEVEIRSE